MEGEDQQMFLENDGDVFLLLILWRWRESPDIEIMMEQLYVFRSDQSCNGGREYNGIEVTTSIYKKGSK